MLSLWFFFPRFYGYAHCYFLFYVKCYKILLWFWNHQTRQTPVGENNEYLKQSYSKTYCCSHSTETSVLFVSVLAYYYLLPFFFCTCSSWQSLRPFTWSTYQYHGNSKLICAVGVDCQILNLNPPDKMFPEIPETRMWIRVVESYTKPTWIP